MKNSKTQKPINGVQCVVNTCHYHTDENKCNASSIKIQPKNAAKSEETDCSTFKPTDSSLK